MSTDLASLYIKVDSKGVVTAGKDLTKLTGDSQKTKKATDSLTKSFRSQLGILKSLAAAYGVYKLARQIQEATLLAARYETLGVVMHQVGNIAGYTGKQMDAFQKSLETTGISMVQSRNNLAKMNQAQIDLNYATKLGRIAQDSAVIGNMNSSAAFEHMIYGLQTGMPRVLRAIGLNVSFGKAYEELAKSLDRTTDSLTERERVQARVNTVVKAGSMIDGTYSAAMDTAGKQLLSLERHVENLKVLLGQAFTPALAEIIEQITAAIKGANAGLSDTEAVEEWGNSFRLVILDIEAAALSLGIALDEIGKGLLWLPMLVFGPGAALGIENSVEQFEKFAQMNLDIEERANESEGKLIELSERRAKLIESMGPAAKAQAQAEQEAAEAKTIAASNAAKAEQEAQEAQDAATTRVEASVKAYEELQAVIDPTLGQFREMVAVQAMLREALVSGAIGANDYREAWQKYLDMVANGGIEEEGTSAEDLLKGKLELYEGLAGYEAEYRQAQLDRIEEIRQAEEDLGLDIVAVNKKATDTIMQMDQEAFEAKTAQVNSALDQMGSMFSSLASMYEEGSSGAKKMQQAAEAMVLVQNTLAVVEAVAAVANQAQGDPYTAFARIAAMAAAMGSLLSSAGLSLSGGGGAGASTTQSTSTALGSESGSESMVNAFDLLQDTYDMQYNELSDLNDSMDSLNRNITGLVANILGVGIGGTSGVNIPGMTTGIAQDAFTAGLDEMGGIGDFISGDFLIGLSDTFTNIATSWTNSVFGGGSSSEMIASGLSLGQASLEDMAAGLGIDANAFALVKTVTDGGWFHSDNVSIDRQTQDIAESTTNLLSSIYQDISTGLIELTTQLGADMTATMAYTFDAVDLNLQGQTADQINDTLQTYFSGLGDTAVEALFGSMLSGYQQVGEGLYETAIRLVIDKAIVVDMLEKIGQSFTGTIPEIIAFSETLINMSGDLETLQDNFSTFYSEFIPESQQYLDLQNDLSGALSDLNAILPDTRDGYADLVQGLDLTTETGQQAYVVLLALSENAASYYSELESLESEHSSLNIELLEAQGNAEEALALQRQNELDSMDAVSQALQQQIWAQEELNEAMETYTSITEALSAAIDSISGKGTTTTQAGFNTLFGQAMGGDTEALAALPGAATTFLAAAYEMSETELEYRRLQSQILNKLGQAETFSSNQLALLDASIPGHATGLSSVPYDGYLMRAHKDEAVLTAPEAAEWRKSKGSNVTSLEGFKELKEELKALRGVMEAGIYQIAKNTGKTKDILTRFDDDGIPAERII